MTERRDVHMKIERVSIGSGKEGLYVLPAGAKLVDQLKEVTPAVDDGGTRSDGVVIRRKVQLGGVNGRPAWPKTLLDAVDDEVHPCLE